LREGKKKELIFIDSLIQFEKKEKKEFENNEININ
jgi:hypothetical protein